MLLGDRVELGAVEHEARLEVGHAAGVPGLGQQVSEPRNVVTDTWALADGEKKFTTHASADPSGLSGPMVVLLMRAGTTSLFHAFAWPSAMR